MNTETPQLDVQTAGVNLTIEIQDGASKGLAARYR
jgi:hypothetical protein